MVLYGYMFILRDSIQLYDYSKRNIQVQLDNITYKYNIIRMEETVLEI